MKYALYNVTLISGHEKMEAHAAMCVLVDGERIAKIQSIGESIPAGYKKIDLNGKYLMPGLINLHTHLPGSGKPVNMKRDFGKMIRMQMGNQLGRAYIKRLCYRHAKTALLSGVTTIRTVGGLGDIDGIIRDEINVGRKVGPRILCANQAISVPGGHMAGSMATIAGTVEEALEQLHSCVQTHPDLIKIMVSGGVLDADEKGEPGRLRMPEEMVKAVCEEAHRLGYPVSAHAESTESVRICVQNGVDTIEHGACLTDEMVKEFQRRNAALIVTLSPSIPTVHMPEVQTSEVHRHNGRIVNEGIIQGAKTAVRQGVPVGLGNDTGCKFVTHYNFWRELVCFHKQVGVSKERALYTATYGNAKILGLEKEIGSIESGKCADLIVLERNPLENLDALESPHMVMARGKLIRQPKYKRFKEMDAQLKKAYEAL